MLININLCKLDWSVIVKTKKNDLYGVENIGIWLFDEMLYNVFAFKRQIYVNVCKLNWSAGFQMQWTMRVETVENKNNSVGNMITKLDHFIDFSPRKFIGLI